LILISSKICSWNEVVFLKRNVNYVTLRNMCMHGLTINRHWHACTYMQHYSFFSNILLVLIWLSKLILVCTSLNYFITLWNLCHNFMHLKEYNVIVSMALKIYCHFALCKSLLSLSFEHFLYYLPSYWFQSLWVCILKIEHT